MRMPTRPAPIAGGGGLRDLDGEADAVLDRAAPAVGALVGGRVQELVDQVAVRAVQLDAVEPGLDRALRRVGVLADGACGCPPRSSRRAPDAAAGRGCPSTSRPGAATAEGARILAPAGRFAGWPTRPVCMSCTKILPPARARRRSRAFQPITCSSLIDAGDARIAESVGEGEVPSVMMSPAAARAP